MGLEYRTGYCPDCEADRKLERKKPNHILHFLITVVLGVFTYGIGSLVWMGVWYLIAVKFNSWVCHICGNKNAKPIFNTSEDTIPNSEPAILDTLKKSYKLILILLVSVLAVVFLYSLVSEDSTSSEDKKDKVEEKKKKEVVNATVDIKDKPTEEKKLTLAMESVDSDLCYIYDTVRKKDLLNGSVSCKEGQLIIKFYDSDTNREVITKSVMFKNNKFSIKIKGLENNDFQSEIKMNEKQINERLENIKKEKPRIISSVKTEETEEKECEVKNWKYSKDSDEYLLIEGNTSCEKGQIILNIFGQNNIFLGKEAAYINNGTFKVYLENSTSPTSLSIDFTINQ